METSGGGSGRAVIIDFEDGWKKASAMLGKLREKTQGAVAAIRRLKIVIQY